MSIKVKNSQLNNDAVESINSLIDMDINASAAFRLTRIIKEISSIVDDKVKMEQKILEKWVERDESNQPVLVKDESGNKIPGSVSLKDPQEFSKEMKALMETENEIPFDKIKFEDLNLKTAKVKDLMKLDFLFD